MMYSIQPAQFSVAVAAVVLVATILVASEPVWAEGNGGFVTPGQPVSDLRGDEAGDEESVADDGADESDDGGAAEQTRSPPRAATWPPQWLSETAPFVGLVAAVLVTFAILAIVWRRRRFRAGAGGGTRLEILDRIALSPRQWVCILRVDDKRFVVGLSGESMTSLAVLDDDPRVPPDRTRGGGRPESGGQLDVDGRRRADAGYGRQSSGVERGGSSGTTRRDESGFWFRPESPPESGAPPEREDDWENHLAPYRREVNRLRAMLQNWRQTTDRGERGETDGAEAGK